MAFAFLGMIHNARQLWFIQSLGSAFRRLPDTDTDLFSPTFQQAGHCECEALCPF